MRAVRGLLRFTDILESKFAPETTSAHPLLTVFGLSPRRGNGALTILTGQPGGSDARSGTAKSSALAGPQRAGFPWPDSSTRSRNEGLCLERNVRERRLRVKSRRGGFLATANLSSRLLDPSAIFSEKAKTIPHLDSKQPTRLGTIFSGGIF